MSEDTFDEIKDAKLANIAHKDAVSSEVRQITTKNEYNTIVDSSGATRMQYGKLSKGVFGIKILDSDSNVVYEISDSGMTFRNILPYNFDDSLDATYPLECEFYMPSGVTKINSCWVHVVGRNFRAYSTGAASGGGQTSGSGGGQEKTSSSGGGQTTSSGGGQTSSGGSSHSHSVSGQTASNSGEHYHNIGTHGSNTGTISWGGTDVSGNTGGQNEAGISGNTGSTSSHTHTSGTLVKDAHTHTSGSLTFADHHHSMTVDDLWTSTYGAHSHSVTGVTSASESAHTHTVANHTHTVANHTHTVTIDAHTHSVSAHTHSLVFGIYESTDITGTNIYVDNGSGYGASVANDNTPVIIDVNIADSLTTTEGWKKIKITSSRLGRVVLVAILDIVISSA